MNTLKVGEITTTTLIERDGPWRTPEVMFPAYDPEIGRSQLAELDPIVFDSASGKMVITCQTFVVHTPRRTVLIDTCTGEDKGLPPNGAGSTIFTPRASASRTSHTSFAPTCISIIPVGTRCFAMAGGRPPSRTRYIFHKGEYERWEAITARGELPPGLMAGALPGNSWSYNCRPVVEAGKPCWSTTPLSSTTISR